MLIPSPWSRCKSMTGTLYPAVQRVKLPAQIIFKVSDEDATIAARGLHAADLAAVAGAGHGAPDDLGVAMTCQPSSGLWRRQVLTLLRSPALAWRHGSFDPAMDSSAFRRESSSCLRFTLPSPPKL